MIMQLLENGAGAEAKGRTGATALYHGLAKGHETVVETLLIACTDVNIAGYSGGQTALEAAAEGRDGTVVEKPLAAGPMSILRLLVVGRYCKWLGQEVAGQVPTFMLLLLVVGGRYYKRLQKES